MEEKILEFEEFRENGQVGKIAKPGEHEFGATVIFRSCCGNDSPPPGWKCTIPKGHDGKCVAGGGGNRVYASWLVLDAFTALVKEVLFNELEKEGKKD